MSAPALNTAKHPDCEDRCQLREHKGYISCWFTGCCAFAEDLAGNRYVESRVTSSPYDMNGLKEYPGE